MDYLKNYTIERNGCDSFAVEGKSKISKLRRFFGDSKRRVMVKAGIPLALVAAMVFPGMAQAAEKTEATIENVNEGVTSIEQTVETDATTYSAPEVITTYSNTVSTSSATTESTSSSSTTETTESTDDVTIEEENDATLEDSSTEIVEDEVVSENSSMEVDGEIITDEVTDEQEVSTLSTEETTESTEETTESTEETTEVEEDNYLKPISAVDGVDVSDASSALWEVHFSATDTNLIIIIGKDGTPNVIWTKEPYGNVNQALIEENLANSEVTNIDVGEDCVFISGLSEDSKGNLYCAFDDGVLVYDEATGDYILYCDKTKYESAMGVSITAKEYIDPNTQSKKPAETSEETPEEVEEEKTEEVEEEITEEVEEEITEEVEEETPVQETTPVVSNGVVKTGDDLDMTGIAFAGGVALATGATASRARRKLATDGYEMDDDEMTAEDIIANSTNPDALRTMKAMLMNNMSEEKANYYIKKFGR